MATLITSLPFLHTLKQRKNGAKICYRRKLKKRGVQFWADSA